VSSTTTEQLEFKKCRRPNDWTYWTVSLRGQEVGLVSKGKFALFVGEYLTPDQLEQVAKYIREET
jgi:hypothetical protein